MEKMFDEYCLAHIKGPDLYCKKVNQSCPPAFCHFTCWGDWKRLRKENTEEVRKKCFKDITPEVANNQDMVTVIIPCIKEDAKYLARTVKAVRETAIGPIEIFTICDNWDGEDKKEYGDVVHSVDRVVGQRYATNWAARLANGKYLFRLDAHCNMSKGWDARMKDSCGDNTIVTTTFDGLDLNTWKGTNRDNGFVRLTDKLDSVFVRGWKTIEERDVEEETMGISGTSFMITKDYYWKLGGSDEELGEYGAIGPEWSCKVWLTGGMCLVRTDVVCYHYFRRFTPFDIDNQEKAKAFDKLYQQWVIGDDPRITRPMGWLVMRFSHYLRARVWSRF